MNSIKLFFRSEDGFTLLEMMIVVTIIGILTAIAFPKFNESLAMANTTRVQADLQSLDTAIIMYKVQHGKAPQVITDLNEYIDVESLNPPSGDVYMNGQLIANSENATYILNKEKTNATFLGQTKKAFSKHKNGE